MTTNQAEKKQKPNPFSQWDGISICLQYLTSSELINISMVCKDINLRANSDILWQSICKTECGKEITKLPSHSWKNVFKEIQLHKKELEAEAKNYETRYNSWREMMRGWACGMRRRPPAPKFRKLESDPPSSTLSSFKENPASKIENVLSFSVDLVLVAKMLLELLMKTRGLKEFSDEKFLSKAVQRYTNFMQLKRKYKNVTLIPTLEIEYVWISHMLRPNSYIQDCTKLFGEVIDHDIYLRSPYNCLNKKNSLEVTAELYKKEFHEEYCVSETILKYQNTTHQHFNTTGCASLDPLEPVLETDSGAHFRAPQKSIEVSMAPSFIPDIGNMKVHSMGAKLDGLTLSDLLMDGMWLGEFEHFMKGSISTPIDPANITGKIARTTDADKNKSHMSTTEVFKLTWKAYEKFLYMAAKYPPASGTYVHPTYAIDIIWHAHMICPKIYAKEVTEWVGYLVDHDPWPECKKQDMDASAAATEDLWKKEFGVAMNEEHTVRVVPPSRVAYAVPPHLRPHPHGQIGQGQ